MQQLTLFNPTNHMFSPIKLSELMNTEYEAAQWLVQDLIPTGGITILSGEPGSYKTWLLQEIGRQVAVGGKVFNQFATQKGNVLFIDEENSNGLLKIRFTVLGVTNHSGIYLNIKGGFHADNERDLNKLIEFIESYDIKLVCIDSLVRIHSKEENVANQMAALFNALTRITRLGATLLMTHHHRKQSSSAGSVSSDLRGSSDILAAIDCHLSVQVNKGDKIITLSQNKIRNAPEMQPIDLQIKLEDGLISFVYQGIKVEVDKIQKLGKQILELLESGAKTRQEIDELLVGKYGKNAIGEALAFLEESEEIEVDKKGRGGKKTYSLSKQAAEDTNVEDSDTDDLDSVDDEDEDWDDDEVDPMTVDFTR